MHNRTAVVPVCSPREHLYCGTACTYSTVLVKCGEHSITCTTYNKSSELSTQGSCYLFQRGGAYWYNSTLDIVERRYKVQPLVLTVCQPERTVAEVVYSVLYLSCYVVKTCRMTSVSEIFLVTMLRPILIRQRERKRRASNLVGFYVAFTPTIALPNPKHSAKRRN